MKKLPAPLVARLIGVITGPSCGTAAWDYQSRMRHVEACACALSIIGDGRLQAIISRAPEVRTVTDGASASLYRDSVQWKAVEKRVCRFLGIPLDMVEGSHLRGA